MEQLLKNPGTKYLKIRHSYIKRYCRWEFISTFRAILYHKHLSKMSKMLAFVMLDHPEKLDQNFSIFARKMGITNASMSKARRELQLSKVIIVPGKVEKIPQL